MLCSAIKKWNDKQRTTLTCSKKATVLLTNKGKWKDVPYCDSCASWMVSASGIFGLPLKIKRLNRK